MERNGKFEKYIIASPVVVPLQNRSIFLSRQMADKHPIPACPCDEAGREFHRELLAFSLMHLVLGFTWVRCRYVANTTSI